MYCIKDVKHKKNYGSQLLRAVLDFNGTQNKFCSILENTKSPSTCIVMILVGLCNSWFTINYS